MSEENEGVEIPGEIEEKARSMGWVPQEEFKGDPDKWRPAEEFVDRGENILPILKDRLGKTQKELAQIKREQEETKSVMAEFKQFYEQSRQSDMKKAYQQALKDIASQQRQAVDDMDTEKYDRLEQQKGQLYQSYAQDMNSLKPQEKQPQQPQVDEEEAKKAAEFVKKNPWMETNRVMNSYAIARSFELTDESGHTDYAQLEKDVKTRFPEYFENAMRKEPSSVEGGGTKSKRTGGKKSFDDLPQQAKDAYARFKKQIPNFSKEDYLKNYQWD